MLLLKSFQRGAKRKSTYFLLWASYIWNRRLFGGKLVPSPFEGVNGMAAKALLSEDTGPSSSLCLRHINQSLSVLKTQLQTSELWKPELPRKYGFPCVFLVVKWLIQPMSFILPLIHLASAFPSMLSVPDAKLRMVNAQFLLSWSLAIDQAEDGSDEFSLHSSKR